MNNSLVADVMTELTVPSPAKINLFLHINGRRTDGYHDLQTVFQFVDYCDQIKFSVKQAPEITLNAPGCNFLAQENLIYKAAALLQSTFKCTQGVDIFLDKKIPMGAGLGGGSSNAATTLLVLNLLWGIQAPLDQLLKLGLMLGADVPIFLHGQAAFAQGVGEQLTLIDIPQKWLLLLFPGCHVTTGKIFSDMQLTRNTPRITIAEFCEKGGHNDCEPVARKHFPIIGDAIDWLDQYSPARMTGTGSCVFATFPDQETALNVAKLIPATLSGIVVKGLNTSPLHSKIRDFYIGVSPSGKARGFDLRIPRFES